MPRRPTEPRGAAIKFPTPAGAFTRGYRRALAAGVDPLEERDAINECPHGRLLGDAGTACPCHSPHPAVTGRKAAA